MTKGPTLVLDSNKNEKWVECGLKVLSTRIVGGTESEVNEFPWQAALVSRSGRTGQPFCGGALLNDRWKQIELNSTPGFIYAISPGG